MSAPLEAETATWNRGPSPQVTRHALRAFIANDVLYTIGGCTTRLRDSAVAEALPLGDATFDVVLCQMGLQFFPDRPGSLREMRRVLRPGGRVAINVPGPTPPPLAVFEQALRQHIGPEAGRFVATVFSLHETDEVRMLLEGAGFTDVEVNSKRKRLTVPPAENFLWQYLFSTPVAEAADKLDDEARAELEEEVVTGCERFAEDGALVLEVDMTSAIGRSA